MWAGQIPIANSEKKSVSIAPKGRLDTKAPALADALRNATAEQQRVAVLTACETVVALVELANAEDVKEPLRLLRAALPVDAAHRDRLLALAQRFDEEYFRASETTDGLNAQALRSFAKARAVSALAIAVASDLTTSHEAIYEAISSLDDSSDVVSAVARALSAQY